MSFEIWYTAALLLIMSLFLVWEWIEVEVTLFAVLLLLVIGKVITLRDAFAGFANEGMITIAFLFVVVGALNNSGMIRHLNPFIFGDPGGSVPKKLLRLLLPIAAISAFMNNTPVVAVMIPVVLSWADKQNQAPSKYLIPISFAAILGGMCTLIGTSTNLIVHGLMIDYGMEGFTLFEISKVGVPVTLLGILFIVIFGYRLLPERKKPLVELGEDTRQFVIELKVTGEYQNIGKTIEEAGLRHLKGLFLFQVERSGEIIAPAKPNEKILLGDRLFFTGIPQTILELQKTPGLSLTKDSHFDLKQYDSSEIKTFECVISPGSPLLRKTVRDSNFRGKYEAVIIAIHRHGERIKKKIGDIFLQPGDTLLVLAAKDFREKWYHSRDFYLIAGAKALPSKPQWRGYVSAGILVSIVLLASFNILPLLSAAGIGVIVLFLTRTITTGEARNMVDWRVLVIIALSLGIAAAIKKSGLAEILAEMIVNFGHSFGAFGVLASIYVLTSLYTAIITNNAAAALLFPIAMSAAAAIRGEPHAFALTVMIAAAASFATPISYQTNLMVYGPGGYKFNDFLKIGIPLQVLVGIMALGLIYYFYF
jgi:di/tricarboxylate transporter